MHKFRFVISIATLLLLFAVGCGQNEEVSTEAAIQDSTAIEEVEETPKVEAPDETVEEELVEEPQATVVGNGSYFIKVNDRVYFREYDEAILSQDKLFGEYRSVPYEEGKCTISYVTENDSNAKTAFEDTGYGPLYFYGDRFYLVDTKGVYSLREDGTDKRYESLNDSAASIEALCENCLFYEGFKDDVRTLNYMNLDSGEQATVMTLEDSEWGYAEIKQIELEGDEVYVDISYIAGTGAFFQAGEIVKAKLDATSEEPEVLEEFGGDVYSDDDWFDSMYFTILEDGNVELHHHKPLSAWISDDGLMICNEKGEESVYAQEYTLTDSGWFKQQDEGCSYLDGTVYLIRNVLRRCAENDVGWREAFNLVHSSYECVSRDGSFETVSSISIPCEDILADVWILNDLGKNRETQVLYSPILMVSRRDKELCERYGLDPDSPDQFFDDYEIVEPYEGQTYLGSVSKKLQFSSVNFGAPAERNEGDLAAFETYMRGDSDINYARVVLGELSYISDGTYSVPQSDYESNTYYKNLLAKISFNEDGTEIIRIEEIYVP